MEKSRFLELTKQIKTGERVRVLFDMIMELIEAAPDIQKADFWESLKGKIVAEQEAIQELTRQSVEAKKPEVKRRKKGAASAQELDLRKEEDPLFDE